MATITPTYIKKTETEAVVRMAGVSGDSGSVVLTNLATSSQVIDGTTGPKVSISGVGWTGSNNGEIVIARGSTTVMVLPCANSGIMNFAGEVIPLENTKDQNDFAVSVRTTIGSTGFADGQLWLRLRKTNGYVNTIEDVKYGVYDDPTRVGASTTMSGSPDKV